MELGEWAEYVKVNKSDFTLMCAQFEIAKEALERIASEGVNTGTEAGMQFVIEALRKIQRLKKE